LNQNKEMADRWLCGECFGRETMREAPNPVDVTAERIAFAQSWNLAVSMCSQWFSSSKPTKEQELMLENWQKYFYKKLTIRKVTNK
jgi:hypothetical protein